MSGIERAMVEIVDVTRASRILNALADDVARGPLRPLQHTTFERSIKDARTLITETRDAIAAGAFEGTQAADAAGAIGHLDSGLASVLDAVSGAEAVRPKRSLLHPRTPTRDLASIETALRDAAGSVDQAAAITDRMPGVGPLQFHMDDASDFVIPDIEHAGDAARWMERESFPLIKVQRAINVPLNAVRKMTVEGAEHVPGEGGALLVPSHASDWDPFFWLNGHDRNPRSMARAGLRLWDRFREAGGAFTVPKEAGNADASVAAARDMARRGELVTIYGEAMQVASDHTKSSKPGAARIAMSADVPVVVAGSYGTKPAYTRGVDPARTALVYTEPMDFRGIPVSEHNVRVATELITQRMEQAVAQAKGIATA